MILSDATKAFLSPLSAEKIGNAQLVVGYKETKETRKFTIDLVESADNGELHSPHSISACHFVERRFRHGYRRVSKQNVYWPSYEVPVTDYSVLLIAHAWPKTDAPSLVFADDKAKAEFMQIYMRETSATSAAIRTANYKLNSKSDTHPFLDIPSKYTTATLLPFQKIAATNAINSHSYALFMAPGTGKTAVAIAKSDYVSCQTKSSNNRPARILVLAPKNVRHNWVREYTKFSRVSHKCTILHGTNEIERNYRLAACMLDDNVHSQVVIAGYDAAVATPFVKVVEWDLIIIDESHNIANPSTQRTKFLLSLRDNSLNRLILTGTPVRNTPFDLYSQLEFLGHGYSGFESFTAFKNFFGNWKQVPGKGIRVLESLNNIPLLQERLAKHSFIIGKEEALPHLPKKYYDTLSCSMTKEQFSIYTQVATELQAKIESIDMDDKVSVNNILTQMLRLAQITSGYAVTDESGLYRFDPNPKLETLVEEIKAHLEDEPSAKIQIWCAFKENVKQIAYRLNEVEGISTVTFTGDTSDEMRIEAERRFNCDKSTKVFIGTAKAGGVGLNLVGFDTLNPDAYDTNCDWVIYYSKNWSQIDYSQSQDRAHRTNTRVPVRITNLDVPGSIDEEISSRLKDKVDLSNTLQDIRSIAANLLANVAVNGD